MALAVDAGPKWLDRDEADVSVRIAVNPMTRASVPRRLGLPFVQWKQRVVVSAVRCRSPGEAADDPPYVLARAIASP